MIEISENLTITISYGDILDVTFDIEGLKIEEDSRFVLSIKKDLDDPQPSFLKQLSYIDFESNSVRIVIDSEDMEKFEVGKWYYDLVYIVGQNRRTLNYPSRLVVKEVVHNEFS